MIRNPRRRRGATLVLGLSVGVVAGCARSDVTHGRYQGMVEYDERALAFETPGRVLAVLVQRGQAVSAGQVVARQDDALERDGLDVDVRAVDVAKADFDLVKAGSRAEDVRAAEAQVASARVGEAEARTELTRQRGLVAKGARPPAGLEALEAQLAAATAARASAEERLRALRNGARAEELGRASARVAQATQVLKIGDVHIEKRTLTSPIAGIVENLYIQPGEVAGAGVPVVLVADVAHPFADVFVPVPEAPRVVVGATAHLRLEGLGDEARGVVELVHSQAEFTPRFVFSPRERPNLMIRVRVRVEDPARRLHAGLPAFVTFDPPGPRP